MGCCAVIAETQVKILKDHIEKLEDRIRLSVSRKSATLEQRKWAGYGSCVIRFCAYRGFGLKSRPPIDNPGVWLDSGVEERSQSDEVPTQHSFRVPSLDRNTSRAGEYTSNVRDKRAYPTFPF